MIFKGLKWSIVNVFFDDICVFSKTAEDHVRDVALVQADCGWADGILGQAQVRAL